MSDNNERDVDKLLDELEAEKAARSREEERLGEALQVDEHTAQRIQQERKSKVSGFKLNLQLDEDFDEHTAAAASDSRDDGAADGSEADADGALAVVLADELALAEEPMEEDEPEPSGEKRKRKKDRTTWGCIRGILYAVLVLGASGVLAYFAITGAIDLAGLGKSSEKQDVVIPQGASTQTVAEVLEENGIIDQPLVFRLYSKLTKADGTYQPGTFTLSPDMGYSEVINQLQNTKPRESVTVTIQEGDTIEEIAKQLEKADVCTSNDFYEAVVNMDWGPAYEFIAAIPDAGQGQQYDGRIYKLEGYIFPDTYEFYAKSAGKTVVKKFLDNFNKRVDTKIRSAISAQGKTIDEIIIMASIIQGEAAKHDDMLKVSRVLYNRLANPSEYPLLQCDSTRDYVNALYPQIEGMPEVNNTAYDTYKRKGLPVGAINNPGLDAIQAALNPSEDPEVAKCYFFATDYTSGITYFSKTYQEHERICRKYKIGIHANG